MSDDDTTAGRPIGPRLVEVIYRDGDRVARRRTAILDEVEARRWVAWFEARKAEREDI